MEASNFGRVCPPSDRPLKNHFSGAYGWRRSAHEFWSEFEPGKKYTFCDDWFYDGTEFIARLGEGDPRHRVCANSVSAQGKIKREELVDPSDFKTTNARLEELHPVKNSLMFDPVLWLEEERMDTTRFGWVTLSGSHPLSLFPEPVIYWAIGSNAYQALIPWHRPLTVKESCQRITEAVFQGLEGAAESSEDDFLFMPGSLIHLDPLPAFTASVLYDAFALVDGMFVEHCWVKY